MKRVFGIDLGTNSIGWSIVEQLENGKYRHIKSGVDIFKDGVDHDKSGEHPCVQLRTNARGLRRHYFRRRLHKINCVGFNCYRLIQFIYTTSKMGYVFTFTQLNP